MSQISCLLMNQIKKLCNEIVKFDRRGFIEHELLDPLFRIKYPQVCL
jgi:hypothetical protein